MRVPTHKNGNDELFASHTSLHKAGFDFLSSILRGGVVNSDGKKRTAKRKCVIHLSMNSGGIEIEGNYVLF